MRVPDLLGTETNGEGRTLLIYVSYLLAKTRKGVIHFMDNPLIFLARPLGLECTNREKLGHRGITKDSKISSSYPTHLFLGNLGKCREMGGYFQ